MRTTIPIALAIAGLAIAAGCGDAPVDDLVRTAAPAREALPREEEPRRWSQPLTLRDVPLAVGATAPRFPGYPERTKAVIVFFRGEW